MTAFINSKAIVVATMLRVAHTAFGSVQPFIDRQTEIKARMQVITDMDPADFTDDHQGEFDRLEKEYGKLNQNIANAQRMAKLAGTAQEPAPTAVPPGATQIGVAGQSGQQVPGQPNLQLQVQDPNQPPVAPQVKVVKDSFEDDPKCGFKDRREWAKAVMAFNYHMDGRTNSYQKDNRIEYLRTDHWYQKNASKLQNCDGCATTQDVSGAVFVPQAFTTKIHKVRPDIPVLNTQNFEMETLSVPRKYRLDKDHRKSVSGGFQVGRNFENCCITSSRNEYGSYTLQAHPIYGAYCASDLLLQTNPGMVAQELEIGMDDEFAMNKWTEILNGTGQGEYLGVWRSKSAIVFTPEGGQNWTDITIMDIFGMQQRLYMGNTPKSSLLWIAGWDMQVKIKMLKFSVGNDCACNLYDPNGPGPHGTLDGIPILFTTCVPGCGYKGGIGLYNFTQYEEGEWQPMQNASSEHAMFMCNRKVFKFWKVTAGAPTWESTLIPKCVPEQNEGETDADYAERLEATATLAPFVVIDGAASECLLPSRPHNVDPNCGCDGQLLTSGSSSASTSVMAAKAKSPVASSPEESSAVAALQDQLSERDDEFNKLKADMEALKANVANTKPDSSEPDKSAAAAKQRIRNGNGNANGENGSGNDKN